MKALYQSLGATLALLLLAVGLFHGTQGVNAASSGKITGTVKFEGTPPHMKGIDMSKDPYCVKQHEGTPPKLENVVVGQGGAMENVVVYVSEGLSGAEASAAGSNEPVFDQKGCMYTPHVLSMNPGQKFKVITSDQTTHNIHPEPNPLAGNIPWNKSQPPGAPPIETSWKNEEFIPVKCNIHPWMHGYFAVVKGPNATTGGDGTFTLDVPPGSYTVTAWQEELGKQTQKVTVAAGSPAKAEFTFKGK